MYGSCDKEWDTEFFAVMGHCFPFYHPHHYLPNDPKNQNFEKKILKMPGDIILLYIHVHNKWRPCDIWFMKYKVQQTEIFDILGQHLDNLENQNFNIEKNT